MPLRIELRLWAQTARRGSTICTCSPILPFALLTKPLHCSVVNGILVGATITDPGCGYTNAPLVVIQGGGGSGATQAAIVTNEP
jgi:hypothetical protein